MTEEIKPNANQAPTQDAQLAAENIASGQEKAPTVDFDKDYEAAQQFSVSEIDRTGEGVQAAEEATKSHFKLSEKEETKTEAPATGNPADYMSMAEDIGSENESATNVNDDLIKQAIEKGQPGK